MKKLITLLLVFSVLASAFYVMPVSASASTVPQYFEDFEGESAEAAAAETATSGYYWNTPSASYTTGVWESASTMSGGTNTTADVYASGTVNNEIVTSKSFNISSDDFEKAGKKLEYGYDLYIPNNTSNYPMVQSWLVADSVNSGTVTKFQEISRGAYLRTASSKLQFEHADCTALSTNQFEGQNSPSSTEGEYYRRPIEEFGAGIGKWAKVKAVVSYKRDASSGTGYYETVVYINDVVLTNASGAAAVYRINERKVTPWGGSTYSSSGIDTENRRRNTLSMHIRMDNGNMASISDVTTNSCAIDNMYIKLYEAPKYEQNFNGVTEADIMTDSSGADDVYSVENNVLKIKGIAATKQANLPVNDTFNISSDDFENADKYLEVGYKIRVPKTLGDGAQVYGLLTMTKNNDAIEEVARTPWIVTDDGNIKIYSVNGTTDANKFAARNYGSDATQVVASNVPKTSITEDYIEYDVKSLVKYVVEAGVGYYATANIIDGVLVANDDGTPSIHKTGAMDGVLDRVGITVRILAKGDGSSVVEVDDLYIRLVDTNKVDISNITINATGNGSASIAYLNTTGAAKTSDSLILAAYNDNNVLLGAKVVSGQTIAKDGASKITAAFDAAVTGATKYKAFYWTDALRPLTDAAGPANAVTE